MVPRASDSSAGGEVPAPSVRHPWPPRRHAMWPVLLVAFTGLLVWRLWAPDPGDRLTIGGADSDFVRQFYPYRAFVARSWATLRPPLWNPHQYAGTPAWADPQLAVLYPWRALQSPLALRGARLPLWAVELEAIVHLALGGLFTYGLLRALRARAPAAALSAVAFGLGGYLTGYPMEQLAVLDTAVWIPATLAAVTLAIPAPPHPPRPGWFTAAVVAGAMMVLAGHPQTAMYGLGWSGGWLAVRAAASRLARPGPARTSGSPAAWLWVAQRPWVTRVALLAGWAAGVTGLSAAAWLPTAALASNVARRLSEQERLAGLSVQELRQLVIPHAGGAQWPLWVGTVPLVLAVIGLSRPRCRFWLGSAGAALLVAMGGHGPVLEPLLALVPGVDVFRHHERAAVVVSLALAVAAGLALDDLLRSPRAPSPRLVWIGLGVAAASGLGSLALVLAGRDPALASDLALAAFAACALGCVLKSMDRWEPAQLSGRPPMLRHRRIRDRGAAVLAAVTALELLAVNEGRTLAAQAPAYPRTAAIAALQGPMPGRVSSEGRLPGGANAAMLHALYDTTGDSPFHLSAIDELTETAPELVWWQLLNVEVVVTDREFPPGAPVEPLMPAGDDAAYRVLLDAPAVWAEALRPAAEGSTGEMPGSAPARDGGQATLTGFGPFRAVTEAEVPDDAVVVLSSAWAPGWRATAVNAGGARIEPPVLPSAHGLASVRLPAGHWVVRWTYLPDAIILGSALSLATLTAGGAYWIRRRAWRSSAPR